MRIVASVVGIATFTAAIVAFNTENLKMKMCLSNTRIKYSNIKMCYEIKKIVTFNISITTFK